MKMNEKLVEIKRGIILDAARKLFSKNGYENTFIDEIAQESGK